MCGASTSRLKIGRKGYYTHHDEDRRILITKWFSY
jgi:hypothetical protein